MFRDNNCKKKTNIKTDETSYSTCKNVLNETVIFLVIDCLRINSLLFDNGI